MHLERQITEAIGYHQHIKAQMGEAVATGQSHHTVARLCQDDQCKLGQWLYQLDEPVKSTHRWKCARDLHADYHREAARVLGLALAGNAAQARAATCYSSAYAGIARRFEAELVVWKKEAATAPSAAWSGTMVLAAKNPLAGFAS